MKVKAAVLVVTFALSVGVSLAAEPPNGELKVAYRQLEEGELSDHVHHTVLSCLDGQCSLTAVTLNRCVPYFGEQVFYPLVERTSTAEGNLSVVEVRDGELVAEERYKGALFKLRYTYTVRSNPELSRAVRLRQTRWFDKLTGFSGGVVKDSPWVGKVITWQLVPIKVPFKGALAVVEPRCKILLDGVPE